MKVKAKANPFLYEYDNYFDRRIKLRENLAIECKQITTFMVIKDCNKQPGVTSLWALKRRKLPLCTNRQPK